MENIWFWVSIILVTLILLATALLILFLKIKKWVEKNKNKNHIPPAPVIEVAKLAYENKDLSFEDFVQFHSDVYQKNVQVALKNYQLKHTHKMPFEKKEKSRRPFNFDKVVRPEEVEDKTPDYTNHNKKEQAS